MRVQDLDLRELLELDPSGIIRFAGQRALILDAVALGLLRKELIDSVGLTAARGILTHFGYAHGWRTAESLRRDFPWDSEREWRTAGGRLHNLQGLVRVEAPAEGPSENPGTEPEPAAPGPNAKAKTKDAPPPPFAQAVWHDSYEAEQHLLHIGRSDEPVCWSLVGFASGYMSYCNGKPIYCIEDRCVGRGDALCRVIGKPAEEWGDEIKPHLPFFQAGCPDARLAEVTGALKAAERRLKQRQQALSGGGDEEVAGIVARSAGMRRVLELAQRVARVDSTVLVSGESGVGKERIARLIHDESVRAGGPFVALNCAAVTETLIESEMFGHAKGAFTGAVQDRPGLFESAGGGTLFLDEIGEIPLGLQAKLLRVLQDKEVRRVGENRSRRVDVRLVTATNRDLGREVQAGRFRQDLYYRLRVIELHVPPLRDRKEDILPLARVMLLQIAERLGRRMAGLTPEAADQLLRYDWPGNVRELENAIERAVVLASHSRVQMEDLPEEVRMALPGAAIAGPDTVRPLEEVERDYILAALAAHEGNQARTAAALKIGTATLYRKLKQYGETRTRPQG
ncbi:MAG TPA: sigma-54-dependent Fis family transcriptional regulator [Polyangia bacterium]|jgi:DNA-binding NtrC family response regulator|nr:sigma-54-dependent Fis family transcriptional regulator [Polyangia bacterium]